MGNGRAGVLAAAVVVLFLASCATEQQHKPYFHDETKESHELSAAQLGDPMDRDSVADFLLPEEREAVRRSGMTGINADEPEPFDEPPPPPKTGMAHVFDTIGKVGVSLLGVALTVGAAIAPFLLF